MMRYLVTITDNISPTSMPYNEIVLYRRRHYPDEKQIVILLFKTNINRYASVPEDLKIHCVGKSLKKLNSIVGSLLEKASQEKIGLLFHIHEAKSILFFALATKGRYRDHIIYTLHSTYAHYALHNKLMSALASFLSGKIVCVGQTAYCSYPALLKKLLGNKVVSIRNGVDCERIDAVLQSMQENHTDEKDGLELIYIARLMPLKRHDILFQALRNLPQVKLFLMGEGTHRKALESLAKEYDVSDRVHFLGLTPRDGVFREIRKHDVYVSSSSYEGLPISLLEAMSCEVVCAASNIAQHREVQEICPSLILVDNTPEDWVKAIHRIASMKKEEKKQIAAQNKRDVDRYFSLDQMHEQYDRVYEELMDRIVKR